ncbi:MAG TPA: RNA polymerase sigma factor [Opitutaceae bacterium]|nr:RNA polymerase sigma factor [Opitutaceae bacterium]
MNLAPRPAWNTVATSLAQCSRVGGRKADSTDFDRLGHLARQAQAGDIPACESLLGELYAYVRRILGARLGPFADLDDLTQECLLGMHKSLATYHPSRNIRPWVHAIIRYKVADHFRALVRRNETALPDELPDPAPTATSASHGSGDDSGTSTDIHELLRALPAPLNRAVVLTKIDGLSCEEAAKREAVSPAALRKRISRAYAQLARLMEAKLESEDHAR